MYFNFCSVRQKIHIFIFCREGIFLPLYFLCFMLLGMSVRWTCKVEIFSIIFNLASLILCPQNSPYLPVFDLSNPFRKMLPFLLVIQRIFQFELFIHMLVTDILVYVGVNHWVWNMLFHLCFFCEEFHFFLLMLLIIICISVFNAFNYYMHLCSKLLFYRLDGGSMWISKLGWIDSWCTRGNLHQSFSSGKGNSDP